MNLNPFTDKKSTPSHFGLTNFDCTSTRLNLQKYQELSSELKPVNEFGLQLIGDLEKATRNTDFRDDAALEKLALHRVKSEMIAPKVAQLENDLITIEQELEELCNGTLRDAVGAVERAATSAALAKVYAAFRAGTSTDDEARRLAENSEVVRAARFAFSGWNPHHLPAVSRAQKGLAILDGVKS
ncbi:MAG: hypothetical protein ABI042_10535 [Verrucomicrobiota bacterium]